MSDQTPIDAALRSRVADLLHLLQFARIETPTAGDAEQAEKAMNDLERMLAAPAAPAAPVAGLNQDSYIDDLLDRMNDAQQEINLAANTTMSQALCAAAALLDEVEVALKRCSTSPAAEQPAPVVPDGWKLVPVAVQPLPYWTPCNPACDPELNGSRSKLCDCAQATAALAAPPAAEQPDAWVPSGADYDRNIHHNPDAAAWADLFVATFPGLADKRDLMLGWIANAMMAMHDHLKAEQPDTVRVPRKLLEAWEAAADPHERPDFVRELRALLAGGAE